MSTYTLISHSGDDGFDIAVVTDVGTRHTVLGFDSQAAAEAWIAHDRRLSGAAHPEDTPAITPDGTP